MRANRAATTWKDFCRLFRVQHQSVIPGRGGMNLARRPRLGSAVFFCTYCSPISQRIGERPAIDRHAVLVAFPGAERNLHRERELIVSPSFHVPLDPHELTRFDAWTWSGSPLTDAWRLAPAGDAQIQREAPAWGDFTVSLHRRPRTDNASPRRIVTVVPSPTFAVTSRRTVHDGGQAVVGRGGPEVHHEIGPAVSDVVLAAAMVRWDPSGTWARRSARPGLLLWSDRTRFGEVR